MGGFLPLSFQACLFHVGRLPNFGPWGNYSSFLQGQFGGLPERKFPGGLQVVTLPKLSLFGVSPPLTKGSPRGMGLPFGEFPFDFSRFSSLTDPAFLRLPGASFLGIFPPLRGPFGFGVLFPGPRRPLSLGGSPPTGLVSQEKFFGAPLGVGRVAGVIPRSVVSPWEASPKGGGPLFMGARDRGG